MRVLHLVHTPGPGGTEAVVANLLSWIPRSEAVQALACPEGPLAVQARDAGNPCYPVPFDLVRRTASPIGLAQTLGHVCAVNNALVRSIDAFQPDIVHAHAVKAAVLAHRYAGSRRNWRLVWHLHDYIPLGRLRRLWIWQACRAADAIATVSEHVALNVPGVEGRATVVHNSLPPQRSKDPRLSRELLRSCGVPGTSPILGYAGRLDAEKGVHLLLRAFSLVRLNLPSARLLIAGGSQFRSNDVTRELQGEAARLGVNDAVHFLGRLPDLLGFYGAITVFAHPAPREPFGLVVLEALAQGIPVVAYDAGGPREILRGFDPSFLVPQGDLEAFAAKCCRLLSDSALQARTGVEGPVFVAEAYRPEVQCRKVLSLYWRVHTP
ncbi:glycosyltransferase family 4 protein [Candidatus Fermentibacteria bacterium]|nr:glycosyltransferase family 4 protein [Candidatus Fermentibacteria bacterium]